jgi:hypothetical protein
VLVAPVPVARAAARQADDPREAWMLRQPRRVRRSYVRQVLDQGDADRLAEAWMLRQSQAVRESYVREVLGL